MERTQQEEYLTEITAIRQITHDVKLYRIERPKDYQFTPGQATEVSIAAEGWEKEKRPFTFTGQTDWNNLEFIIKSYKDHDGVTSQMGKLSEGDKLWIGNPWGAIKYKGPGTFIAGGAGITPFIAIFRDLAKKNNLAGNRLLFSNKTHWDIILEQELTEMLQNNFINTLTSEKLFPFNYGRITTEFLRNNVTDFSGRFYICGPEGMIKSIQNSLEILNVGKNSVIVEL